MISVIVPVYNSEKYLKACIDSIIKQTYTDLEIICVNDGSTDGSLEILREFACMDSRVVVHSQENHGVSTARNVGLKFAHGEFVSFIDSDDEMELDMYELLIQTQNEYQADIVHCGYKRICRNGTIKEVFGTGTV